MGLNIVDERHPERQSGEGDKMLEYGSELLIIKTVHFPTYSHLKFSESDTY